MNQPEKQSRYCFFSQENGAVSIKLTVDRALVAGVDFKLYHENLKDIKENWKMSADSSTYVLRTLRTVNSDLNKKGLVWQLLCCSTDPSVYEGDIEISVVQNNETCKMIPSGRIHLKNIPPCSLNNPVAVNGSLTFIVKT